jgi:hypothetical protein
MDKHQAQQRVREVARQKVGKTIATLAQGRANEILSVSNRAVIVKAKKVEEVTWEMIDGVINELFLRPTVTGEELRRAHVRGGFRSAFIFALLVTAGVAVAHRDGRRVVLRLAQ